MKKLKIFLDTSVYSAIFDKRDPIRQSQTRDFWNSIEEYDLYFADIIEDEIEAVPDEGLKNDMIHLLAGGKKVEINKEVIKLSNIYI